MSTRTICLLLVSLTVLAYVTGLPGTFHYDDAPTILRNEAVTSLRYLPRYFVDPSLFSDLPGNKMYRPVLLATYLLDYGIGGFRPFVWHLTNILLHALNVLLVFFLTRRLVALFRVKVPGDPAGFIAGIAFAFHPVHSEVVNYISSRSSAIAAAGFLGALLLHLAWTRGGATGLRRGLLLAASLACLGMGLGGKEIAIALVPTVVLLEILDTGEGTFRRRLVRVAVRAAPALVLAVLFVKVRGHLLHEDLALADRLVAVKGKVDLYWGGGRSVFQNVITQARVFWMYVALILFPTDLAVDRFVRVSTEITEPAVLASLLGIVALLVVLVLAARRRRIVCFCGLAFGFGLAPTAIIPLNVVMNEHRLYLPGTLLAVLIGAGMAAVIRRWRRPGIAVAVAIAACWLAVLLPRSLVWQDPWKLWQDNIRVSPRSFRAHNQLGSAWLMEAQRMGDEPEALPVLDKAIASLGEAERLYPSWFHAQLNLGIAWRRRGRITGDDADFEESLRHFEICRSVSKNQWRARYQIATTYGVWGKVDRALEMFREMAAEDPGEDGRRLAIYVRPMAKLELDRGSFAEAAKLYRELLDSVPEDLDAHLGLARALVGAGRRKDALQLFRGLLERRPEDAEVHLAIASFLLEIDPPDRRGAAAQFQKALMLGHPPTPEEFERYLGR